MAPVGRLDQFDESTENIESYLMRVEAFFAINDITTAIAKRNALIAVLGARVLDELCSLLSPESPTAKTYDELKTALVDRYKRTHMASTQRHKLSLRKQKETESVSQFIAELRVMARTCDFGTKAHLQEVVLQTLLNNLKDIRIQEKLLPQANLTLDQAIIQANSFESLFQQLDAAREAASSRPSSYYQTKAAGIRGPAEFATVLATSLACAWLVQQLIAGGEVQHSSRHLRLPEGEGEEEPHSVHTNIEEQAAVIKVTAREVAPFGGKRVYHVDVGGATSGEDQQQEEYDDYQARIILKPDSPATFHKPYDLAIALREPVKRQLELEVKHGILERIQQEVKHSSLYLTLQCLCAALHAVGSIVLPPPPSVVNYIIRELLDLVYRWIIHVINTYTPPTSMYEEQGSNGCWFDSGKLPNLVFLGLWTSVEGAVAGVALADSPIWLEIAHVDELNVGRNNVHVDNLVERECGIPLSLVYLNVLAGRTVACHPQCGERVQRIPG
ncbi:hypothetical protein B566_EDAN009239 [Ephemera danica]|nr:hypothetical protein B566_EDAN009239 [Ephemera danica]